MKRTAKRRATTRTNWLVPLEAQALKARAVVLAPGGSMHWHTTGAREELVIVLAGRPVVELLSGRGVPDGRALQPRACRMALRVGQSLYIPAHTVHRVINPSRTRARYIYVTASVSPTAMAKKGTETVRTRSL
jgi:quercetin dioxygenase-like cupin family protein